MMNHKIKHHYFFVLLLGIYSCGSREKFPTDSKLAGTVAFEFLDSVVVESLSELYIADKDKHTDRLMLNDWEMNEMLITDLKGEMISRIKPRGEGPNQVQSPLELAFWKEGYIVKEISAGQHLHFFNSKFEKTATSPALAKEIFLISMPNYRKSFSVVEKHGKTLMVGYEHNAINAELWNKEEQHAGFYDKAEAGYIYEPATGNLSQFNLYPATWRPRLEQKWVGIAYPLIQANESDQVLAVLPTYGDQLFYYTLNGAHLEPLTEVTLSHPEREQKASFDVARDDSSLYPFFDRLSGGGKYFLIEFTTAFPRELYNSFKAKGENFHMDPEYREASKKYRQTKYILTDTKGNQAPISELPVPGVVHLLDADDVLYIKPNSDTELDCNVFYRYQLSLE